jgi:gamma-butyrobetaine dioxygenase
MRERSKEETAVDQRSFQRLYDPETLEDNLTFADAKQLDQDEILIKFSDQHEAKYSLKDLLLEVGRKDNLPQKILWNTDNLEFKEFNFDYSSAAEMQMLEILEYFHQYGFVVVKGLHAKEGEIINFAERIGFIRETNFGKTFDVRSKKQPNDLAYTSIELGPHTDNPYRRPVPSIQFLFCVENSCVGGNSTLADGFQVAKDLKVHHPDAFKILTETNIFYRFTDQDTVLENTGTTIELDDEGNFIQIRFSNRLDLVPYQSPDKLARYYEAKRIFHKMINSEKYLINFRLPSGGLLIMDNYRLLHGRTSFNTSEGSRFLQGLYIDHDSIESKYKILKKNKNG